MLNQEVIENIMKYGRYAHTQNKVLRVLHSFLNKRNDRYLRKRLIRRLVHLYQKLIDNRDIYAYEVICDERNNPPNIVDSNQLRVTIHIKQRRCAEYIRMQLYVASDKNPS